MRDPYLILTAVSFVGAYAAGVALAVAFRDHRRRRGR